jgi:hypothetical protein
VYQTDGDSFTIYFATFKSTVTIYHCDAREMVKVVPKQSLST